MCSKGRKEIGVLPPSVQPAQSRAFSIMRGRDPHTPARLNLLTAPWHPESAALEAAAAPRSRFGSFGEVLWGLKIMS